MRHEPSDCDRGRQRAAVAAFHTAGEAALCASIAHEINQPLAAIVANASACRRWLAASAPDHARVDAILERILENAVSVSDIVGGLRALFTQRDAARAPAQINDIIREASTLVTHEWKAREVEIVLQLDPALPALALDRVQIRQLLVNLVRNAIEAMETSPGPCRLKLRSRRHQSGVRVDVCDRGSGVVDPARMFDAFFSTKANGMGIGLAICRQIVQAHGGRLWMEQGQPHGTRMTFTLPKRDAGLGTARGAQ